MFEVEKPRRFHYEPRFYDPEKEKWEALKKKYAIEKEKENAEIRNEKLGIRNEEPVSGPTNNPVGDATDPVSGPTISSEEELAYFENRLRDLDRQKREASSRLTWRDLFRKREMPKFQYQPRFNGTTEPVVSPTGTEEAEPNVRADNQLVQKYSTPRHKIKIRRRFDIGDTDYMKPIPGTKIILYTGIVCLLLAIIFLF